ncbi:hypothetical protein AOC36_04720 [Erysipelothrix larvae]|uniref:Phosphoesterase n=1 Tax=Erysipelothrix larvae TaxID=1514105 RepID=A0A120JTM4_9FIRM|nr:bifunctional oligoribonuclease/PAP phosphatase NrnA [Erysipelothrix larvae]AMC93300.1 hypothetical protein AOC36_04720 [Erysipelothrix larvae]
MKNSLSLQTHIPSTTVNKFYELVERYDTICIFRHENPDGDAFGAQCGLKHALSSLYPHKRIVALGGNGTGLPLFPLMDEVDDACISGSLAIIVDCANRERIDDKRFDLAQTLIKIDHHPEVDIYGDLSYVVPTKSSACEIVSELLMVKECLDEISSSYLLAGMMTDTIRFSIETTTADTLMIASHLMTYGANINKLSNMFFTKDLKKHSIEVQLAPHIQYKDGVAWLIINQALRESLGLSVAEAKLFNNIMSGIKEYKIWAIFVEEADGLYLGSLRSQSVTINTIAQQYNGGGHRLASGLRQLTRQDVDEVLEKLMHAQNNG